MTRLQVLLLFLAAPLGYLLGTAFVVFSQLVPQQTTWILIRSTGWAAYALFTLTTAWGFAWKTTARNWFPALVHSAWHRYLSMGGAALMLLHAILLLFDRTVGFSLAEILIPGLASYRPQAVALGIVALYALGITTFGYYLKDLVKSNWWAIAHKLVPVAWALATLHGIMAGSDTALPWARTAYLLGVGLVSFFAFLRLLAYPGDTGQKAEAPVRGMSGTEPYTPRGYPGRD